MFKLLSLDGPLDRSFNRAVDRFIVPTIVALWLTAAALLVLVLFLPFIK